MRTTMTLEDDVAAQLEELRRARRLSLKEVVNQALRLGLAQLQGRERSDRPVYRQPADSLGGCLLPSIDDVATAIELGEGDGLP